RDVDVPQRRDGFLDFSRVDTALRDAAMLWLGDEIELYEGDDPLPRPRLLAARVSLESDRSFASYENALAHFETPPLRNDTELYWSQGLLDVLLEYPIRSDRSQFSMRPQLERLGIKVNIVLRFLPPSGEVRAFDLHGDPGRVLLDPRWYQQPLALSTPASSTSWAAPTICFSCSAWSFRSAVSGRWSRSSPPSPSRIRSR